MFKYGEKSAKNLSTTNKDLQLVMNYSITRSNIDFGISRGYSSPEEQFELFKLGRKQVGDKWVVEDKSKIVTYKDGFIVKSKHNTGDAVDIFLVFKNNKSEIYNRIALAYVAGIIRSVSEELYAKGMIQNKVVWGANWDDDSDFIFDHEFVDMPHFQTE